MDDRSVYALVRRVALLERVVLFMLGIMVASSAALAVVGYALSLPKAKARHGLASAGVRSAAETAR